MGIMVYSLYYGNYGIFLINYGNYGIFLIVGHAGFCPSTVGLSGLELIRAYGSKVGS